ncbi:MAG: PAS domain S-box protein, partial [Candidatus Bathyarchaeia archaeon]
EDKKLLEILASHAATALSNLEHAKSLEAQALKIQESQQKFERLFRNNPEAVVYCDSNFRILDINPRFSELFGYSLDEVKGKKLSELIVPEDKKEESELLVQKSMEGTVYYDTVRLRKDGSLVSVSISSAPIIVDGRLVGYIVLYKDITEKKLAEEALRRSEQQAKRLAEFQKKVIDTATVWINLLDVKGNVILWNRAAELISGYTQEEVIGHNKIWEWLYPDKKYREEIFAQAKRIIEKGESTQGYRTVIRCKDGKFKTISWYSNNILDENGKSVGSIAVGIDITETIEAQEKVRKSEEKYRMLFENARDAIITMDLKGNITSINKHVENYGFKKDKLIGKNMLELVPKKHWPKLLSELAKLSSGKSVEGEVEIITPKGKIVVEHKSSPIWENDKVVGIQTILRDVTERRKMEEKLKQYSEHLEELVKKRTKQLEEAQKKLLKSERLAAIGELAGMVGHDLRNPLTSIAGASYYLKKRLGSNADAKVKEILELID